MKLNRKSILILALLLSVAMATTGTLAYLQDTDSDVNVMTLGSVYIEQHEQQLAADGVTLEKFEQAKEFYPGSTLSKIVTVENTGKSEAYFRTLIAFESIKSETFEINFPISEAYKWSWGAPAAIIELDGVTYEVYEALYTKALPAGETSPASLTKVEMSPKATNEDMEALGGTYEILVLSQAVQTAGFSDAETALNTAFGLTSEKAAEWFGGIAKVLYIEAPAEKNESGKYSLEGEDAASILDTLKGGTGLILDKDLDVVAFDTNELDAKGASVTLAGQGPSAYGYLAFVPDQGEDVTVSNLNVTGAGFVELGDWSAGGGNYTAENLVIKDLAATLKNGDKGFNLACAFCHYGNATLKNCVMTGATAVQEDTIPADLGCVNNTNTAIEGGEYGVIYCWSHANVTISGAKVDTLQVAPIKGTVTVKAGTHVDTINIDYGTSTANESRLAKLVIEEGASVNKILFDGNTYTLAEWLAR